MRIIQQSESYFKSKTCPQCGKKFICWQDTWVYTRSPYGHGKHFFCSWSCLQAYDEQRKKQHKRRGRRGRK